MRLLADENIPLETIRALRGAGHDVFSASESKQGASDDAHIARAIQEDRLILTFDLDFGQLAATASPKPVAGVLLLRLEPQNPEEVTSVNRLTTLSASQVSHEPTAGVSENGCSSIHWTTRGITRIYSISLSSQEQVPRTFSGTAGQAFSHPVDAREPPDSVATGSRARCGHPPSARF